MGGRIVIVLDTHAWIWWCDDKGKLSTTVLDAIATTESIGVPAICCWELAMLASKERIRLSMDVEVWMKLALQRPKTKLLPLTPEIAVLSTRLPGIFHGDPADRLIVASTLSHNAVLVTKDQKIIAADCVEVCW